jgi:NaMN:DMB phosphoribosyltransferase
MRPTSLAATLGAGRVLIGIALLAVPDKITRAWVGTEGTPAVVLARCMGGRDMVVGAGTALAAARHGDPVPWLVGGAVADAIDGAATLAAGDRIPPHGRLGALALAGGGALAGACVARALR